MSGALGIDMGMDLTWEKNGVSKYDTTNTTQALLFYSGAY